MKCPRCGVPVESGDSQCSVCGEILDSPDKSHHRDTASPRFETENSQTDRNPDSRPRAKADPMLQKLTIAWMVCCGIFAVLCIGIAFVQYSIEAMWASFIAAGLIGAPILFIVLGRTVEVAHSFRKELTVLTGVIGGVACFYLLAKGIQGSDIHVETAGMQELATNGNFTRTLITGIICVTIIAALLPLARMLFKGAGRNTELEYYKSDSQTDLHARSSENNNSYELRKLELEHELELRKLELDKERIRIEGERVMMLTENRTKLLSDDREAPDFDAAIPKSTSPPPPPPA